MSTSELTGIGRHRARGHVLPDPPTDAEKDSYAWRSLPFLATALTLSAICLVVTQAWFEIRNAALLPYAVAVFGAYTLIYLVYQAVSLPVNFAGRSFDAAAHGRLVDAWQPHWYPSVDIFLPICGEPVELLHNTWIGVFELVRAYQGDAYVYVLDDGPSDAAMELAPSFGFTYVRLPRLASTRRPAISTTRSATPPATSS